MFQFEAGQMARADASRAPGINSMFKSMEYIYTDSEITVPSNGSETLAGWKGDVRNTRPDNLLWALTVVLVGFQVYRYGPRWWAGAIGRWGQSRGGGAGRAAGMQQAAKDLADTASVVGALTK